MAEIAKNTKLIVPDCEIKKEFEPSTESTTGFVCPDRHRKLEIQININTDRIEVINNACEECEYHSKNSSKSSG